MRRGSGSGSGTPAASTATSSRASSAGTRPSCASDDGRSDVATPRTSSSTPIDLGLQLVERAVVGAVAAHHPQAHEHGGEDLRRLLVQRVGEPPAVVLLRVEQAAETGALLEQAPAVGGEAGLEREQLQRGAILGVERAPVGDLDPAERCAAGGDRRRGTPPLHAPGHGAPDALELDRGAGHARRADRRRGDDPRQPVVRAGLAERQRGVEQSLPARVDRPHAVAEAARHRGDRERRDGRQHGAARQHERRGAGRRHEPAHEPELERRQHDRQHREDAERRIVGCRYRNGHGREAEHGRGEDHGPALRPAPDQERRVKRHPGQCPVLRRPPHR